MNRRSHLPTCAVGCSRIVLTLGACLLSCSAAVAGTIHFVGEGGDGHPVSGSACITLDAVADTVTIELTNTTPSTFDAGELLTALDFSLGGLTPTLTSATGIKRDVAGSGSYTDAAAPQSLSWSLVALGGGDFQLNFTPDAKNAIIGPPTGGNYAGGNASIRGNAAHNPFVAETAVFELSVPGLGPGRLLAAGALRFGTGLEATVFVPEPASWLLAVFGLVVLARRR